MIKYRWFNKIEKVFFKWDISMGFSGTNKVWEDVERFTGYSDRKNTEIYEGDIIKREDGLIGYVFYQMQNNFIGYSAANITGNRSDWYGWYNQMFDWNTIEVV